MKECAFSIVRNPFSRTVSMYEYNKRLFESFEHFVRDFHAKCSRVYEVEEEAKKVKFNYKRTDAGSVYCHVLPMHAYTHKDGKQIVPTIIKQEQLKKLNELTETELPAKIREAISNIPHANARKKKKPWQEYYTKETMHLVLDMYKEDFEIFGYDKEIPNRPDLVDRPRMITL